MTAPAHQDAAAAPAEQPGVRVTLLDDDAPHQMRVFFAQGGNAVSCTCQSLAGNGRGPYRPLEVRRTWDGKNAAQAWRDHLTRTGDA